MKKILSLILVFSILTVLPSCFGMTDGKTDKITAENTAENTLADTSQMDFTIPDVEEIKNDVTGDTEISVGASGVTVNGDGAVYSDNTVTVTQSGIYRFSGTSSDMMIYVNASKKDSITLVLDGVNFTSARGPALFVESADSVILSVTEGTDNTLSDASTYSFTSSKSTPDAAVFSCEDLTVCGKGKLTVNGNHAHGIVSKDDLFLLETSLTVQAKKSGISGKDSLRIGGGSLTVNAGTNGICATNTEDSALGYIYIEGGEINVTSSGDGIQAETVIVVSGGDFNLTTGGGSGKTASSSTSMKGIKAVSDIQISGGNFNISSADDSLHSNKTVYISGGTIVLSSGDDGVHADETLQITGGNITVSKSYEGLEAETVSISGGNIKVTSSDDGINAAGGADASSFGRPGSGYFTTSGSSSSVIKISGGYIFVNASGDGVDSNGDIEISGGVTVIAGPTSNGDSPFDYGDGNCKATVTGGILLAVGSSGMATTFSSAENQGAIYTTTGSLSAGTTLSVLDADGAIVVSFVLPKQIQCLLVTSPTIQKGKTYTVATGGTAVNADENGFASSGSLSGTTTKLSTVTMTSLLYGNPSGGFGPGGGQGGGPGGGRR